MTLEQALASLAKIYMKKKVQQIIQKAFNIQALMLEAQTFLEYAKSC